MTMITNSSSVPGDPLEIRDNEDCITDENFLGLQSGYVMRADDRLPRQGSKQPWMVVQNYLVDLPRLRFGAIDDGVLEFSNYQPVKKKGNRRPAGMQAWHWPSFYNVVTGKTLALPNLIALQHIPLSPAGVIAKRPAPIALPNSCAA